MEVCSYYGPFPILFNHDTYAITKVTQSKSKIDLVKFFLNPHNETKLKQRVSKNDGQAGEGSCL